jgi:hypothetical protein
MLKAGAAKILTALFLLAAGAFLALLYLDCTIDPPIPEVERFKHILQGALLILLAINSLLESRTPTPGSGLKDISPARSGVMVVLLIGAAAAVALGWRAHHLADFALPALVAALTIVVAGLVYRFASRHRNEIGEARFVARPGDEVRR